MHELDFDMRQCIDLCGECAATCFSTAMNHCLEQGGEHVKPEHFRLMMACVDICKTSAAVMMTGIKQHVEVCRACAEICNACADSCERIAGMEECASVCRQCAESCEAMSKPSAKAA